MLRFVVQGDRAVRLRALVVLFCHRVSALMSWQSKVAYLCPVFNGDNEEYFRAVGRGTGVMITLFGRFGRGDEYPNLRPVVVGFFYFRHVRCAGQVRGTLSHEVGVVAVVRPNRLVRHFFVDNVIDSTRRFRLEVRDQGWLFPNGAAGDDVVVPRASVLRLIRVARCACLNGFNRSNGRDRARIAVKTFRCTVGDFRSDTVLVRRDLVLRNLGRKLIMFICRSGSVTPNWCTYAFCSVDGAFF